MNFGFLVQKWPFRDAYLLFKKKGLKPLFYSVFWVRAFWAKVSKREILKSHQEKWKNLTDNWKAIFGYFCCFFFLLLFSCFFWFPLFFFVFFGGFKGQVRWPEGPPHLALNPPYLFIFVFFVFFGGFKGQVRWPKGPPHLALNPPYLLLLLFFFVSFLCFLMQKTLLSP